MIQSSSSQWQKNDIKYKDYQCPCGKTYLSYPALYTHIKQTHGGKAPGQIKRPDTQSRGRPKNSALSKIQQHKRSVQQALKIDPLPQLLSLMQQSEITKNRQMRDVYENQPVFKLIMNDKDKPFQPKYIKQDRVFDVKMGEGIILFFKQIEKLIQNKNIYDQIVMLIVLLSQHIIQETQDQNVLSLGNIGLMPQFVNYFIIHDFRKPLERLKLQKLWIFQDQNPIRILDVFFRWILYKKFTLTKVQVNERYFVPQDSISQNSVSDQNNKKEQKQQGLKQEQQQSSYNKEDSQFNELNSSGQYKEEKKEDAEIKHRPMMSKVIPIQQSRKFKQNKKRQRQEEESDKYQQQSDKYQQRSQIDKFL